MPAMSELDLFDGSRAMHDAHDLDTVVEGAVQDHVAPHHYAGAIVGDSDRKRPR